MPKRQSDPPKHGFYARQFRSGELKDLDLLQEAGSQPNLIDEIAMLRVSMRRTMELAQEVEDIDTAVKWLNALGASAVRIAALLRTQKLLGSAQSDELNVITQAINQLGKDWNLEDTEPRQLSLPFKPPMLHE
jgi:hypothetical protein